MTSLNETINRAMAAVGPATEGELRAILAELEGMNLGDEDRLSVLATAIAAAAAVHHGRHKQVYLEALRTWSLEISVGLAPPPVRFSGFAGEGLIEEGAEILISGLESLLDGMANAGVRVQDRLVTELALFSRLLGQHDAHTIHVTLMAVGNALATEEFQAGRAIQVPLGEMTMPLGRDVCLATIAPRGVA